MATFFQAKSDFDLRLEPKIGSELVEPLVSIDIMDQLEIVGDEVLETIGAAKFRWVKVKCAKGEGFANRDLLRDFVAPPPVDESLLPIELRRTLELPRLATLCYRNALRSGTNSAILLALAHAETGDQWTTTLAQPRLGNRIGIYGFTQDEWNAALAIIGPGPGIKADEISRVRAQCEVVGLLMGRAWQAIAAAGVVRAIDLYVAMLASAEAAVKLAAAKDADALSAFLSPTEIAAMAARTSAFVPAIPVADATTKGDLVKALAAKLETALAFVRTFADGLVADNVPPPEGSVEKTENELAHEDPEAGDDDGVGPGSSLVLGGIEEPPPQPADGTVLACEAHLVALWKRSMFPIDGRGIILFGIRGCLPADPSTSTDFATVHRVKFTAVDYRQMRCTIGQWRPGKGFALFPGSTVPFSDLVDTAAGNGGANVNQMGRGRYRNYVPGWHKRGEGKGGHWALLQESDISFQRTAGDVNYTPSDPWDAGRPGDNIHCAFHVGTATSPENAAYSSAGCQVIAGTVEKGKRKSEAGPWKKFIAPFLGSDAQSGAEYVLFDGRELREMATSKMAGKTVVLRMGSESKLVHGLQEKLGLNKPDGKFGKNTFRAVMKFQHANFGKSSDDGIVGAQTAQKLGLDLPLFDFNEAISNAGLPSSSEVIEVPETGSLGAQTDPKFALLLDLVSREESHGNYNAFFGKIDNQNDPRFTEMTVKQVQKWQRDFVAAGSDSSAAGKYQIIMKTMKEIIGRLDLDGNEIFDASLQDRMAIDLLGVRQLGRFLSRKISVTEFGNNLAMEWAALPVLSTVTKKKGTVTIKRGRSFHSDDGLNKAHIEPEVVEAALQRLIS